ncbi:MAG: hypothetical protein JNL72_12275 [Flavipsychrobacter sp.]|nr:hypothetical protein [Flavipsychrobacter sp.]
MSIRRWLVAVIVLVAGMSLPAHAAADGKDGAKLVDTLFTLEDAEKILGEKTHFTSSRRSAKTFSDIYVATYTADAKDKKSGVTGELVCQVEWYKSDTGARRKFADLKRNNDKREGVEAIPGMGDEAYSYGDGETFYVILVRKGASLLRIRVEKVTAHFSSDAIEEVAERITDNL